MCVFSWRLYKYSKLCTQDAAVDSKLCWQSFWNCSACDWCTTHGEPLTSIEYKSSVRVRACVRAPTTASIHRASIWTCQYTGLCASSRYLTQTHSTCFLSTIVGTYNQSLLRLKVCSHFTFALNTDAMLNVDANANVKCEHTISRVPSMFFAQDVGTVNEHPTFRTRCSATGCDFEFHRCLFCFWRADMYADDMSWRPIVLFKVI